MHFFQKYTEDDFQIIELSNDAVCAKIVVNIGNSLYSLSHDNSEKLYFPYTFDTYKSNTKLAGNPFLHPWANRLEDDFILVENHTHTFLKEAQHLIYRDGNNLPMHGLLLKTDRWKTIDLYEEGNVCYHVAELIFDDEEWLSLFPFKHRIQMKHQLKNNELTIETIIINHDEKSMPISFGYHPYFLIDSQKREQYTVTVPANNLIETNDKMIPTGNILPKENFFDVKNNQVNLQDVSLDNGFENLIFNDSKQAVFSINELQIIFDKHYLFAQIYAPNNMDKPYVCIEPMTAATNAINKNQCRLLNTNEKFSAVFSIVL